MGKSSLAAPVDQTITGGINEGRFMAHLSELFSTSTTVVGELMQNARRAGATFVNFAIDAVGDIVVTDNGRGIDDFAKLIIIAESGWSEDVMEGEAPFGIGFISTVFAADAVLVESRGKEVELTLSDLVEKRPVAVKASNFIGGTQIVLKRPKPEVAGALEAAVRKAAIGFPTDVQWQGDSIHRPNAQANLPGEQTEHGWLYIPGLHGEGAKILIQNGRCYCQGLPVHAGEFTHVRYHNESQAAILHIDPKAWKPRVPDRDTLINPHKAAEAFADAVRQAWISHLERLKQKLKGADGEKAFAKIYWDLAGQLGRIDLMNDVGYLPQTATLANYPVETGDVWDNPYNTAPGVSRAEAESGQVTLCTPEIGSYDDDGAGNAFPRAMLAQAKGWRFVENLHEDHWARKHVVDLVDLECEVRYETIAETKFHGRFAGGKIILVKDIAIRLGTHEATIMEPVLLGDRNNDGLFLVPVNHDQPAIVLKQASSYVDEHGVYNEDAFDDDWDQFSNLVAVLKGEDPAKTLAKALRQGDADTWANLRGKSFTVAFDDKGKFKVTEVAKDGAR